MGGITLIVSLVLTLRLSDLSLPFFSRRILHPISHLKAPQVNLLEDSDNTVLVLESASWHQVLLLAGVVPNVHFLIPVDNPKLRWYHRFFYSIHIVPEQTQIETLVANTKHYQKRGIIPCLLVDKKIPFKPTSSTNSFFDFFKRSSSQILFVRFVPNIDKKGLTVRFEK
jgi:hypothetical protein